MALERLLSGLRQGDQGIWVAKSPGGRPGQKKAHNLAVLLGAEMNQPTQSKPDWWPQCPWPEDVFTLSLKDVRVILRNEVSERTFTAVSGTLMRQGWEMAEKEILERLKERGIKL